MTTHERSKAPAVDGAVLIIDLLASSAFPLTLSEICEKTGLPAASGHRIINALLEHQMVALNTSRKKSYCIGAKIFQVASTIYSKQSIIPFFYPIAEILKNEIHRPIFLSVPIGNTVVVVSKLESSLNATFNLHIGQTMPLHSSASGKAILSMFNAKEQLNYLAGQKKTSSHFSELLPKIKADLERAKRLGYAVSQGDIGQYVSCIAAPILNLRNEPIAAISTAVSNEFLTHQEARDFSKKLIQAARQLSSRIV
ncbi:MAG: IclR family KDG regulon transcriptional repressor [Oleispira sp.]|jgi:IclR family KDG regulon transcriptional repressor|uniref:IclR family transcriptional regulator n=1 Tax=Marinomonas primoryensis TaxID=178399 RepID=UPI003703A090